MKQPTQRQKVEAKESAILEAAHQVFAEAGTEGARISVIAKLAGVAEGTIYLYYRNKAELLDAVVGRFWQELTSGASASVQGHDSALDQLAALARYHLDSIVADYPFVALTSQVRQGRSFDSHHLDQIRNYVRVFDDVVRRGQDRGEFAADLELWQLRDVFYGSLEYSARTLHQRGAGYDDSVVVNLMRLIRGGFAVSAEAPATPQEQDDSLARIEARLARIEQSLGTAERGKRIKR